MAATHAAAAAHQRLLTACLHQLADIMVRDPTAFLGLASAIDKTHGELMRAALHAAATAHLHGGREPT
jgi:hypothetical protein